MSIWWSLHLRREAASVPLARRLLIGTMETAGVDPEVSYDLSLALTEACANAVEHGGETDPATGEYRVTAYLDGEKCRIEVADSGPGLPPGRVFASGASTLAPRPAQSRRDDGRRGRRTRRRARTEAVRGRRQSRPQGAPPSPSPSPTPPPETSESGRGLCLIRELADDVHFGNKPGRDGGAVISFDKILKWREDAPLMVS
ncbi:ATP-binding protein [Streptomyces longispororuber]|uniref:ATP-binding protein n=1 Tax=Streptomyces longispororuber TaxID=68230 RepID=UPI0033DC96D1